MEGTTGEAPSSIVLVQTVEDADELEVDDPDRVAFITQTTLSVDETTDIIDRLQQQFPNIVGPKSDDICYATTNRQIAVKQLARECDLVLVIGSTNSSNSNRLVEVAREHGAASHLIDNAVQVREAWLDGVDTVGITSGASAPEELVTSWSTTSGSAAPTTSPSCGRSTRTSASCSRRRSGPSSRLAADRGGALPLTGARSTRAPHSMFTVLGISPTMMNRLDQTKDPQASEAPSRGDPRTWAELARQLRVDSVRTSSAAGSGHPTSSMSAADLMAVLVSDYLRYDFGAPDEPRQ